MAVPNLLTHVFVYGTLMPGGRWEHVARQNAPQGYRVQSATLAEALLADLQPAGYPALFWAREVQRPPAAPVQGYLYSYSPADWPQVLPLLDELEGVDLHPPLYRREACEVMTQRGPASAWVYVYARPQRCLESGLRWLSGGYWNGGLTP